MPSHLREAFSFLLDDPAPVPSHGVWARPLVDRKHSFPGWSQVPELLEPFCPSLHRADSSLRVPSSRRAHSSLRVLSYLRAASELKFQASPHSAWAGLEARALFLGRACPLPGIAVRLAVEPTPHQTITGNRLSVECLVFS